MKKGLSLLLILTGVLFGVVTAPRANAMVVDGHEQVEIYLTDEGGKPLAGAEFEIIAPTTTEATSSALADGVDTLCLLDAESGLDCASELETSFANLYNRIWNVINDWHFMDKEYTINGFRVLGSGKTDQDGKLSIIMDDDFAPNEGLLLYGIRQASSAPGYRRSEKIRYFRYTSTDSGMDIVAVDPSKIKLPAVGTLDDYDIDKLKRDDNYIFMDVINSSLDALDVKQDEEAFERVRRSQGTYQYYLINTRDESGAPDFAVPDTSNPRTGDSIMTAVVSLGLSLLGLIGGVVYLGRKSDLRNSSK